LNKWKLMFAVVVIALVIIAWFDGRGKAEPYRSAADGVEISVQMERAQFEPGEEVTVVITVVNRTNVEKTVTVPVQPEGIALVRASHQLEHWQGDFHAAGDVDRSLSYTLAPNEVLEQHFVWDQQVMDQISMTAEAGTLPAPSGRYTLYAVLLVGEKQELINATTELFITGDRDLVSYQEAIDVAFSNNRAKQWFTERTYDYLVKEEDGAWYLKDVDGSWVRTERETAEQLKDVEPRYAGGVRDGDWVQLHFTSTLGGPPQHMMVTIDTGKMLVTSVGFPDE